MNETRTRIFIVEDEALIAMEIKDRLTRLGYVICGVAARGETAFEQVADAKPDLVLLDINLAGTLNGIDTARRMHEQGDIPVVFLTAYSDDEMLRRAEVAAPFGYLVKPFEERELHATIQMALAKHRLEHALRESNERLEQEVSERTTKLEASEARLRHLISASPAMIYSATVDGSNRVTFISPNALTLTGYFPEAFTSDPGFWPSNIHPDDASRVFAERPKLFEQDSHVHEYRFRHKNGEWRWLRDSSFLIRDAGGAPREIIGASIDITERRDAELALRHSEARLKEAQRIAQVGYWIADLETGAVTWSDALYEVFGRSPNDFSPTLQSYFEEVVHPEDVAYVQRKQHEVIAARERQSVDHRFRRPDGTEGWAHLEGEAEYDDAGRPVRMRGIAQDITERKRAEIALKDLNATLERRVEERTAAVAESERFNRATLDSIGAHLAVLDGVGRVVATNTAWRRFAAGADLDWQRVGDNANYLEACARATGEGASVAHTIASGIRDVIAARRDEFTFEYPCNSPSGERWFLCRAARFERSGPLRVVVTHDDVTTVHKALERAAAGERIFASLAMASPVGIFRADAEGRCDYVNRRWCEIAGLSEDEARGEGWVRALHPEDRARVVEAWNAAARSRAPFRAEYRFQHPEGGVIWVIGQAVEIADSAGRVVGYMGTLTDVTERKRIELAMQALSTDLIALEGTAYFEAAARRLASLADADMAFITRLDAARPGELRTVALIEDGTLRPNFNYPVVGTPCAEVIEGHACTVARDVQRHYPGDAFLVERRIEAYAGEPLLDHAGRPLGHLGVMSRKPLRDAATVETVLKMFGVAVAAAVVRERSRRQYADLFEFAPDGLVMTDRDGRIALVNRQAERIFGWTQAEMIGQPVEMLVPPELRDGHTKLHANFRRLAARRQMGSNRTAITGRRKDGSDFPVEIDLATMESEDGVMVAASVRDITARRALEAQLAQAIKMDAIGKLTGGMAHDFNNYLGVIIGNLDLLKERGSADPAAAKLIDATLDGALRSAELTRSLLAFSRQQTLDPKLIDLSQRIDAVISLLQRTLGEDITLTTTLASDLWPVRIDGAQLDSCIINLANNARDAMPKGGVLALSARNVHLDEQYEAENSYVARGDYVLIEVADTGVGMPPETAAHVFEPFFTTKPVGHGTGLGLSMVYGFVKQSGGHVKIYSEVGHGTAVRIYLPRHRESNADEALITAESPAQDTSMEGRETILVVEDNEQMRQAAVAQLTSLGYRVIEAASGSEALTILEELDRHLDLLFTDIVMPGKPDGYELGRFALERRPGVKVLLTSGFPGNILRVSDKDVADLSLLSKPYRMADLARAIRKALETKPI